MTDNAKPLRKRLARPKLGKISVPAKAAQEQVKQKVVETQNSSLATTAPSAVDTTSASFKPDDIAAESSVEQVDPAAAATLELLLKKTKEGEKYIDMFWTDVCERDRTGEMLLFGKVSVEKEVNKNKVTTHVSC